MTNEKGSRRHVLQAVRAYKALLDVHSANGYAARQIAEEFGISRNALQQGFKKMVGIGIREYKLRLRMERSRLLLLSGKHVKEVSLVLHYTQPRAFSTAFKKYYGVTPGSYKPARLPAAPSGSCPNQTTA